MIERLIRIGCQQLGCFTGIAMLSYRLILHLNSTSCFTRLRRWTRKPKPWTEDQLMRRAMFEGFCSGDFSLYAMAATVHELVTGWYPIIREMPRLRGANLPSWLANLQHAPSQKWPAPGISMYRTGCSHPSNDQTSPVVGVWTIQKPSND